MPAYWPTALPQQFTRDGYQDAFADNRLSTSAEVGPALIRSRMTAMARPIAGVMHMRKDQLVRLRKFWKDDTLDGKLPFYFPDPVFGYGWRRNLIPNSTQVGAAVGNPGTLPTGWTGGGTQNGIAKEVTGFSTEGGIPYIDLRFNGYATSGLINDTTYVASAPAVPGRYTHSNYVRMIAGSTANVSQIQLVLVSTPSQSNLVDIKPLLTSEALATQRYSQSWTPTVTGLTAMQPRIRVRGVVGLLMDITLRVGGVQLELAASATEFMPTPNDSMPVTRFRPGGAPPQPTHMGGDVWAVNMELEIFEI